MPSIPVIQSFIPQNTPAGNIRADTGATLVGRAYQQAGQDIGQVGQQFEQVAQRQAAEKKSVENRVQAAADQAGIYTLDNIYRTYTDKFNLHAKENGDKETYFKTGAGLWEEAKAEMAKVSQGLSQFAKPHAEAMIAGNAKLFSANVSNTYIGQKAADAGAVFDAEINSAIINMSPEGLDAAVKNAEKVGWKSKVEIEAKMPQWLATIDANKFAWAVKNDTWEKDIVGKYKLEHLKPMQQTDLIRDQVSAQMRERSETQRELDTYRSNPSNLATLDTVIPGFYSMGADGKKDVPMSLRDIRDEMNIDGKWIDRWMKSAPIDDPRETAKVYAFIGQAKPGDFDIKTQKGAENYATLRAAISSSGATASTKSDMDAKMEKMVNGKVPGEHSIESWAYAQAADAYNRGHTLPYILKSEAKGGKDITKDDRSPLELSKWEVDQDIPDEIKDQGRANYAELRDAISQQLATKPDSSNAEVLAVIKKHKDGWAARKATDLINGWPQPNQQAIDLLKEKPDLAPMFDRMYGITRRLEIQGAFKARAAVKPAVTVPDNGD
jgi:hypothetical protein